MTLEEEIKQKKFLSPQIKAYLNIQFTGNWLSALSNKFFAKFELTNQQYNVLRILRGHSPIPLTLASIQGRMLDKSSNVTRLIDKLVKRGFVTSERNNENKRKVDILITPKGLEFMAEIDKELPEQENILAQLTDKEADLLNELLDRIRG
ncbi:MAG: MarR family winged helix-turn-helix transcriptional regulator [Rhodothermaceae bacterium]